MSEVNIFHILEVTDSHLYLNTGYYELGFSWFYSFPLLTYYLRLATAISFPVLCSLLFTNYPVIQCYTVCPTRYRTRHFFNNFTTNEDIATKFGADYRHTLQTHSFSFLTQRMYSCSNFVTISSLVLELLKKCRVW